jgi:hypothetical protein
LAMPTQDRVRLHDDQGRTPVSPGAGEQEPKQSISVVERGTLGGTLEHGQLLTEGRVFKRHRSVSEEQQREGSEQDEKCSEHELSCRVNDQESNGVAGDLVLAKECVQTRQTCSVGISPTRVRVRSPAARVASVEETKRMKPTDKAIFGMASESPGRNASEPSGSLDKK